MADEASRTVLIIDDDPDVSALLEALVVARPGYRSLGPVTCPSAAASALAADTPDVIVVGSHREEFDAIEVVARIRRVVPDACIVLLADLPDPITLLDALAGGADTVISSGSGWSELMPAIDLLMNGRSGDRDPDGRRTVAA